MKSITVLGATGSIGRRTLELVSSFPDEFSVAAWRPAAPNVERVAELCRSTRRRRWRCSTASARDAWRALAAGPAPSCSPAPRGWSPCASDVDADVVGLGAWSAAAGLLPTMAAIEAGRTVALANKETLVMAGQL